MRASLRNRLSCLEAVTNSWLFRGVYGDRLTMLESLRVPNASLLPCIYIDPLKVEFKCNLRGAVQAQRTLMRGGDWDLARKTFVEVEEFRQLLARLEQRGEARGMKSHAELYDYMLALQCLYRQIANAGRLMTQSELGRCAFGGEINCAVSRNGVLMKTDDGNHRFAIARALGLRKVPVQVSVIHPEQKARIDLAGGRGAIEAVNSFFYTLQRHYQ
jgi:hypothetical protein